MKRIAMIKIVFCLIVFTLMVCWPLARANAKLSSADKKFLMQCQVPQIDIDIIPQLPKEGQDAITKYVAAKDCKKLTSFKATRDYYRQLKPLKPKMKMPLQPKGFDAYYLTEEEFNHYADLLTNAPLL